MVTKPKRSPSLWRAALLERQANTCAWCSAPLTAEAAEVDHDHRCCGAQTGKCCLRCIRGAVHQRCNKTISRIETLEREGYSVLLSLRERKYLNTVTTPL